MLSDSLKEISNIGMSSYFENKLTLQLNQSLAEIEADKYKYQSPTHNKGIGFISTYDPRYSRIILHKKDYYPLRPLRKVGDIPNINFIYYEDSKFYIYPFNGADILQIDITNPDFFANDS